MNEEEKMVFWGDLVEPIMALIGGLLGRGEDKLVKALLAITDKAENAVLEEREACAQLCDAYGMPDGTSEAARILAVCIRARGLKKLNRAAEQNGEKL